MRILDKTHIDFLGKRTFAAVFSALVIGIGVVSLVMNGGPAMGIDFAGGSQVVVRFAEVPEIDALRRALEAAGLAEATIQEFGGVALEDETNEVMIRTPLTSEEGGIDNAVAIVNTALLRLAGSTESTGLDLNTAGKDDVLTALTTSNPLGFDLIGDLETAEAAYTAEIDRLFDAKETAKLFTDWAPIEAAGIDPAVVATLRELGTLGTFTVVGSDSVGAAVGRDLRSQTIQAIIWALVGLLAYISYRFEFKFGVAAVVALVHDVLIVLGAFSLTGREFNLPVVAAFLTIVGYSLNDTVVVFDRIRENTTALRRQTLYERINTSLNQTLSRTMLTSLTTLIVVMILFLFGGPVINDFAFALLVGVIVGTYSSVFVATPVVYAWQQRDLEKRRAN